MRRRLIGRALVAAMTAAFAIGATAGPATAGPATAEFPAVGYNISPPSYGIYLSQSSNGHYKGFSFMRARMYANGSERTYACDYDNDDRWKISMYWLDATALYTHGVRRDGTLIAPYKSRSTAAINWCSYDRVAIPSHHRVYMKLCRTHVRTGYKTCGELRFRV